MCLWRKWEDDGCTMSLLWKELNKRSMKHTEHVRILSIKNEVILLLR